MQRFTPAVLLLLAACGSPGLPTPSGDPRVAIVDRAVVQDVAPNLTLRLSRGQVLTPAVVAGRNEYCSEVEALFVPAYILERHKLACFYDASTSGRFSEVAVVSPIRVATFKIDVPYSLESGEPRRP